ncbi:hypothetical protein H6G03_23785 [Planktothrix sp. FACHB-1375]|uniref:Uncharacterized protein n=2 Tax=Cyanophyceae TaxID=3028117 RepID=A0A926VIZ9_9CYAN|nr:hypothetical protein [Aerosakkonema funiforme FACHB-1375]
MLGLLSQPLKVLAVEDPSTVFPPSEQPDFWPPAQELVQQQIYLISRIERALLSPDPDRVKAVRGQLFLHTSSVDRLLKSYYPFPNVLCAPTATENFEDLPAVGSLSAEQVRVYCLLYSSTQKLDSLRPLLDRRVTGLDRRSETVETSPIAQEEADPILGVGRVPKQAIANYEAPIPPAIVPPLQATAPLLAAKTFLDQARKTFPRGTPFTVTDEVSSINGDNPYGLFRAELEPYAQFLGLPNTGITRILKAEFYNQDSNNLRNRLLPTNAESFPFTNLLKLEIENSEQTRINDNPPFVPQLEIQIADDNFQIFPQEINYGFLVDIGDIPLENIDSGLSAVATNTRQFFLNYRPPNKLASLQVDRRRFITGKEQNFGLSEPIFAQAPAVLNHTYLVRTVQFQLPEVLLSGDPITNRQRRILDSLLETPSADLLIAFRPVYRRSDGSYTVLWRVVKQFPNPQIVDLEKYLNLERSIQ